MAPGDVRNDGVDITTQGIETHCEVSVRAQVSIDSSLVTEILRAVI